MDLAPTLARIIRESSSITLIEVDKFKRENGAILFQKVRDLKGQVADAPIRHRVGRIPGNMIPPHVLQWAEPSRRAVIFQQKQVSLICIGHGWYQVQATSDGWSAIGPDRPDLPLGYYGPVSRLSEAVELMLAGKWAVIATLPHGAEDEAASFDMALNRPSLPGLIKVQRIRANLRMANAVLAVANNPAYFIGPGPAGEEEIPALIEHLSSPEAAIRAESADDLRSLGKLAREAAPRLVELLDDPTPPVRFAAAAALLCIEPGNPRPLAILEAGLVHSSDPLVRRHAARAAGVAGPAVAPLAPKLAGLLTDADELTQVAALQAISTLGPQASAAFDDVLKLLDNPARVVEAADALGRMGAVAHPAQQRLAQLLASDSSAHRWAGIRAMSQIGGPGAAPAVDFMIQQLRDFSEVEGYNMMIYLALIGPHARDALPSLETARIKNQPLRLMAMWAIEPDQRFPWLAHDKGARIARDAEYARFLAESFMQELGDRFRPASRPLAEKIMNGSAGDPPIWAYRILARFPENALPILTPGLASSELAQRQRATVALGYMGPAALPAKAQLKSALGTAPTEREQRLLQWALRQIAEK